MTDHGLGHESGSGSGRPVPDVLHSTLPGVIVPVYQPEGGLCDLVRELLVDDYPVIVVVDDGSSDDRRPIFEELEQLPRVHVLRHVINLGKGDALKSGINFILARFPELPGLVTVDADGQHLPKDVLRVAEALVETPAQLCLGVRDLRGKAPLRSRIGSWGSKLMLAAAAGAFLQDTQTGLRGIPAEFAKHLLRLRTGRYEFEFDMLIRAGAENIPIRQVPISTVYLNDNAGSHFNPILDSLRVYFVFLRFVVSSLLTASLDILAFSLAHGVGASLLQATIAGRLVAGSFNFLVNRQVVFKAGSSYGVALAKYVTLVVALMAVSYRLTLGLIEDFGVGVYTAKLSVEGFLFLVSFSVQRLLVFTSGLTDRTETDGGDAKSGSPSPDATDWDAYYQRPGRLAVITRRTTSRRVLQCLRMYRGDLRAATILEIGGGNSSFFDAIQEHIAPAAYEILDSNGTGLEFFRQRDGRGVRDVVLHALDVTELTEWERPVDICYSVGLIEHFDREGTREAVRGHFRTVRPGGLVVLFFPTPTWLYRMTRRGIEMLGMWAFHDERPLAMEEVVAEARRYGEVVFTDINWSVVLTQGIVVVQVAGSSQAADSDADATSGGPSPR